MAQIAVVAVMALMALNDGAQKRKMKMAESEGLHDAANRKMAATTAKMEEERRLKEHMEGRALAVAAASGAGIDDPTMVNLIGDLNAEGEYRILSALYVGQDEAEGLRQQSMNAFREGQYALQAGYMNAAKTVMSAFGGGAKAPASSKGFDTGAFGNKVTSSSMSAVQAQPGGMEIPGYAPGGANA